MQYKLETQRSNDQVIRFAGECFRSRAATVEQLPYVIELLACCKNQGDIAAVMLCRYRGLAAITAGKMLRITGHQVTDRLESVGARRNAAKLALRRELALVKGGEATAGFNGVKGVEMSLAELERLEEVKA